MGCEWLQAIDLKLENKRYTTNLTIDHEIRDEIKKETRNYKINLSVFFLN